MYERRSVRGERESSLPTLAFHPEADRGASAALVAGVDVAGWRRCRRARSCMARATRETEFGELEPCTTHTHTPTRLLSILWRARFPCNIYTPTRGRAHRWCYVWFWVLIFLFFIGGFCFFKLSAGPSFPTRVQSGPDVLKLLLAVRRGLILSSSWKILCNNAVGRNVFCVVFRLGTYYYYYYFIFPRRGILWVPTKAYARKKHSHTCTR